VLGWKYGVPTIVLDVLKGLVPALVASLLVDDLAGALAGGAAMLGHARPLFLKFERGGKAVATTGGVLLGLAPVVALLALGVWVLTFLVARYVSVASMTGAVSVPVFAFVLDESWPVKILALGGAAAVIFLHRENIRRLFARREPRVQIATMFRR
jgi:glycerol-3-phosphate acyltransferase PlsY